MFRKLYLAAIAAFALLVAGFLGTPAEAASKFWVGGGSTTNWNATGPTNWADSSGGAGDATVPTTGDDVIFDSASGSGTAVLNVAASLNSFDCDGFVGTITHNASITITITGNDAGAPGGVTFRLASGMTFQPSGGGTSRLFTLTSTSGTSTITTNGKSILGLTTNGAGGTFVLGSNLSLAGAGGTLIFTHTAGTFDANGFNVTCLQFTSSNTNTRVITRGAGTWTITGTSSSVWDLTLTTGLTHTDTTSTLHFVGGATITAARTINLGGSQTYNNIILDNSLVTSGEGFPIQFGGAPVTIANLTISNNVRAVKFTVGTTVTVTGTLTMDGTQAKPMLVQGSTDPATLSVGSAQVLNWLILSSMTKAGAGTITADNSVDLGATSGFAAINAPASGFRSHIIGGGL